MTASLNSMTYVLHRAKFYDLRVIAMKGVLEDLGGR